MIYKNLNHHLKIIVLIQLFLFVNRDVYGQLFMPGPRVGHTANLVGGSLLNDINLVYQFDTKTNVLSIPTIQGFAPISRAFMSSVNYGGKIYMFGGIDTNDNTIVSNDLNILDTINLNWGVGSLINAPPPVSKHTATLINGVIYFIGGMLQNNIHALMTDIYQYDIVTDTWSLQIATLTLGAVPGPRVGHSAVLVGNKICIFGGIHYSVSPNGPIAMLDTTTLIWSIPQFENSMIPLVPNLVYHTATMVDNFMFVAFGNDTNVPEGAFGLNNDFYIFDFSNFTWFSLTAQETANLNSKSSNPSPSPSTNVPKSPIPPISTINTATKSTSAAATSSNVNSGAEQQSSNKVIVGLSVGLGAVGIAAVAAFSVLFYRRKKNRDGEDLNDPITSGGQIPSSQRTTLYQQNATTTQQPNQQFVPQYQYMDPQRRSDYSNNLTQFQGYSGQEYSILPIPPDRFSDHYSSNYSPGSETYPYSPGSEIPPPPPPKTP
ncbi:hypothetical protein C1645_734025 [Glomus cerebriforme]|uniref:Attractin/MKLN-like beta-propeller domain-containing protein n=1 Tax=Glomus cerebriforme TaxID=658196 RepID=A0A397TAV4_9GLOM|nr:hypothetical protein C1645_734025 [Glomus cerebriforme]